MLFELNRDVRIPAFLLLLLSRCVCVALFPGEATVTPSSPIFTCWPQVISDLVTILSTCEDYFEPDHLCGFWTHLDEKPFEKKSVSYAFKARQHSARLTHAIAERKWPHILVVSKQPTYVLGTFQRTWRQQAHSTTLIVPLAASACDSDIHTRYM